ncbi:hypothetical protein SRHO_G00122090 [Serrasalmus rhombeus]
MVTPPTKSSTHACVFLRAEGGRYNVTSNPNVSRKLKTRCVFIGHSLLGLRLKKVRGDLIGSWRFNLESTQGTGEIGAVGRQLAVGSVYTSFGGLAFLSAPAVFSHRVLRDELLSPTSTIDLVWPPHDIQRCSILVDKS